MSNKNKLIIKVLIKHIKSFPKLYWSFNFSNKNQLYQLYQLSDYLSEILYVLKTGISWRDDRSHIHWNSIYKVYIKLSIYNIFSITFVSLFNKYIKKSPNKKLNFILTDTSFIPNKNGKNVIGYNKFYNRKKGTKISLITDSYIRGPSKCKLLCR